MSGIQTAIPYCMTIKPNTAEVRTGLEPRRYVAVDLVDLPYTLNLPVDTLEQLREAQREIASLLPEGSPRQTYQVWMGYGDHAVRVSQFVIVDPTEEY